MKPQWFQFSMVTCILATLLAAALMYLGFTTGGWPIPIYGILTVDGFKYHGKINTVFLIVDIIVNIFVFFAGCACTEWCARNLD